MKQLVRTMTRVLYKHVAKPLLFLNKPDGVHSGTIVTGKFVQRVPGLRELPRLWAHTPERMLRQTIFGVSFSNPVGLAAGFDKSIEVAPLIKSIGMGFMTGGSVTAIASDGNPRPWFYRLPQHKSLVVHAGLPNSGVAKIARTLDAYPRRLFDDFPLVVSVAKTNAEFTVVPEIAIEDYCASLARLERSERPTMYEINISCPNAYGGEPFTAPETLDVLLGRIDELKLTRPVVVKMPIDLEWPAFRELLDVIIQHDVRGVTIGNLLKNRVRGGVADDLPETVPGGLSGMPTQTISTDLIRQTYREYGEKLVIIGVGGIFTAADAYAKIRAGASLVELVTGMIYEGPQVVGEINAELLELLKADGFTHVSQAVGAGTRVEK